MALGTAFKSVISGLFPEAATNLRKTLGGMEVDTMDEGMLASLKDPELVVGPKGMMMGENFNPMPKQERESMTIAKKMFERGEANEDILAKTGFFFDEAGTIKKEIDDANSIWKIDPEDLKTTRDYQLKDVFDHPSLFNYYPHFEDMKVQFYKGKGTEKGEFAKDGTIRINKNSNDFVDGPEYVMSTMLHEIQHAVQRLEKFSQGGDWQKFLSKPPEFATDKERREAFKKYLSIGGEAESRNVELRYLDPLIKTRQNFLQSLTTDPQSKKFGVTKDRLIDTKGNPIDIRSEEFVDPTYTDPLERMVP